MSRAIKTTFTYCISVALVILVILLIFVGPIVKAFINDAATVSYGQTFLRILTLASPVTAINIMVITIFQAIGLNI